MPYPTATIFAPWHALVDDDGTLDGGLLPSTVARTDVDETFDADLAVAGTVSAATLDVAGDLFCGEDLGVAGTIVSSGMVTAPTVTATTVTATGAFYERGRGTALGEWVNVPFNAGNFGADAGTWTVASGNVGLNRYTLIGKTALWMVQINAATLAGSPVHLLIALPFAVAQVCNVPCALATDGTPTFVRAFVLGYLGALAIRQENPVVWTAGANNYLSFTAICELS